MLEELALDSAIVQATPLPVEPTPTVPAAPVVNETPVYPSPSYALDLEVGIVVIQFRNQSGKVELSIPTQKQLDAYAAHPFDKRDANASTTA